MIVNPGLRRFGGLKPALNLVFTGNGPIDSRITFSRASTVATRVNSAGLIETLTTDQPRFDYDPVTLAPKGLLLEEARTNLLLNSVWAGGTSGTEGSGAVAPTNWIFPATTGSIVFASTDVGNSIRTSGTAQRPMIGQTYSATAQTYTASCRVLTVTSGTIAVQDVLGISPGTATQGVLTYAINGVSVIGTTSVFTGASISASVTVSVGGTVEVRYGLGANGAATGDVTIAFPNFEASSFPTSYIPTTTATVTRAADVASMTGTNFSSWFNPTEGTIIVGADLISTNAASAGIIGLQTGATNGYLIYHIGLGTGLSAYCDVNNAVIGSAVSGAPFKAALGYSGTAHAATANGAAVQTITAGAVTQPDRMYLGTWRAGSIANCHIQRITYYNKRLPDATLQRLSI